MTFSDFSSTLVFFTSSLIERFGMSLVKKHFDTLEYLFRILDRYIMNKDLHSFKIWEDLQELIINKSEAFSAENYEWTDED